MNPGQSQYRDIRSAASQDGPAALGDRRAGGKNVIDQAHVSADYIGRGEELKSAVQISPARGAVKIGLRHRISGSKQPVRLDNFEAISKKQPGENSGLIKPAMTQTPNVQRHRKDPLDGGKIDHGIVTDQLAKPGKNRQAAAIFQFMNQLLDLHLVAYHRSG